LRHSRRLQFRYFQFEYTTMIKKVQSAKRKVQSLGFTLISKACRSAVSKACECGFTLIELLVVISIIGILSTLLMANVGGVRERARDAQRKNDINQVQKALEMYKNSQKPPVYPNDGMSVLTSALTTGDFMKTVPHDPKYVSTCTVDCWPDYYYDNDPESSGDKLTYKIVACLENASDQQKDATKDSSCSKASYTRYEP